MPLNVNVQFYHYYAVVFINETITILIRQIECESEEIFFNFFKRCFHIVYQMLGIGYGNSSKNMVCIRRSFIHWEKSTYVLRLGSWTNCCYCLFQLVMLSLSLRFVCSISVTEPFCFRQSRAHYCCYRFLDMWFFQYAQKLCQNTV